MKDDIEVMLDCSLVEAACQQLRKYALPQGADNLVVLNMEVAVNEARMNPIPRNEPALAAIKFSLSADEGAEFLRCWLHGDMNSPTAKPTRL